MRTLILMLAVVAGLTLLGTGAASAGPASAARHCPRGHHSGFSCQCPPGTSGGDYCECYPHNQDAGDKCGGDAADTGTVTRRRTTHGSAHWGARLGTWG